MIKNRIFSVLAVVAVAAAASPAAAQQPAPAAPAASVAPAAYKIGFVNTQKIVRDSRLSQQAQKALEAEFQKREKEIAAGPPAQADRRRRALADDIAARRDESLKAFVDKANLAIKRIAEAEKYDLVIADANYVAPRIDLTDKVIKALDSGK